MKYLLALIACLPFASHATCYTVYNKTEQVIFQSENPPVDMTQTSIAQELQSKFGVDAVMIFNGNPNCTEILALEKLSAPASTTTATPAAPKAGK